MATRILHCGNNVKNYNLCISEKVAGFRLRGAATGDILYLAVHVNNVSYCGAKGVLAEITEQRPWDDAELYKHCLKLKDIEYCKPFDLKVLLKVGGKYWQLKYIQGAKAIVDDEAVRLLETTFSSKRIDKLFEFIQPGLDQQTDEGEIGAVEEIVEKVGDTKLLEEGLKQVPEAKVNIMWTFLTINFFNETSPIRGLETLVNENFYSLFTEFPENKTFLIPHNRLFLTKGLKQNVNVFPGIRSIPDALLIVYNKNRDNPLQINLIEYECYGERRVKLVEKTNYFNGQIIPQLMKFASTFSIVTDKKIREGTMKEWSDKIIKHIYSKDSFQEKIASWIKELEPGIKEQLIAHQMSKLLEDGFRKDLRIILVIDELSTEQKDTMDNVIKAFKLENGQSIQFKGFVVRLEQRINLIDGQTEYGISVQ
jgi:hypothetical protein